MLIKRYIGFVMQRRLNAMAMALLWAFVPFMGWLSSATMALVTLRKGGAEGALILFVCLIPRIAFLIFNGDLTTFAMLSLYEAMISVVLVWTLATVLREKVNWTHVLSVGTLIGVIGVLLAHGLMPDLTATWKHLLVSNYDRIEHFFSADLEAGQIQGVLDSIAKVFTGFIAASIVFSSIFVLIIGRAMQAVYYNPGGLGQEFYQVRLGFIANTVLLLVLAAIYLGIDIAWDILPLILIMFFVAGLSLFHAMVARTKNMWLWIILFYLLIILLFQLMGPLVIILAIIDTWINFRSLKFKANK